MRRGRREGHGGRVRKRGNVLDKGERRLRHGDEGGGVRKGGKFLCEG